jgi:hypothetical protein
MTLVLQIRLDPAIELPGLQPRLDQGDSVLLGGRSERLRRLDPLRDKDAGNV